MRPKMRVRTHGELVGGRYEIVEFIARGPLADVYLANDTDVNSQAVLKIFPSNSLGDADELERYLSAVKATRTLYHPGIIVSYDAGFDGDDCYLASQHTNGGTLNELLEQDGHVDAQRATEIGIAVADVLAYAHHAETVHGNLKPSQIIVRDDGSVAVRDFATSLPGQVVPNTADDLEALGRILYELVTAEPPADTNPIRLADIDWSIPTDYAEVVEDAMQNRFISAAHLRDALIGLSDTLGNHSSSSFFAPLLQRVSAVSSLTTLQIALIAFGICCTLIALGFTVFSHHTHGAGTDTNVAMTTTGNTSGLPDQRFVQTPDPTSIPALSSTLPTTTPPAMMTPTTGPPPMLTQTPTTTAQPRPAATTTTTAAPPPTTAAPTTTTTPPGRLAAPPANTRVTFNFGGAVNLAWDAVPQASGYVVQLKLGGANGTQVDAPFNVAQPAANFTGLQLTTTYTALIWPSDAAVPGGPGTNQPHTEFSFTTS